MILAVTLFVVVSIFSTLAEAEEKPNRKGASATVFADKCVFRFPIPVDQREWKWGVSPASHCEYSWMVTVKRGDTKYQIGYSFFNPTATPSAGTLSDLLAAGQSNAWELDDEENSATYVEGLKVVCRPEGKYLRIVIDDKEWTRKLFSDKPTLVTFETSGTQLDRRKHAVKVLYKPVVLDQDHSALQEAEER